MSRKPKTTESKDQGEPPVTGATPPAGGVSDSEMVSLLDSGHLPQSATIPDGAGLAVAPVAPSGYRLMRVGSRKPGGVRNVQYLIIANPAYDVRQTLVVSTHKSKRGVQNQLDQLGGAIYGAFRNVKVLRCRDVTEEYQ